MHTTQPRHFYTTIAKNHWNTIVIGGGQAGLAAGYHLKKAGDDFIILDASVKTGDSWRSRWDSLRLFTPPQFNTLPGWPHPSQASSSMTKDQMAEYLELYARQFSLPVRLGIRVIKLSKGINGFVLETAGQTFTCNQVIVATGTNQQPYVPAFAEQLDPEIVQLHAATYHNPGDIPYGNVLVVGGATSGIEIALELSKTRHTILAGKPSFVVPAGAFRFGQKFYWWFTNNILTINTPIGRKARANIIKGGAVIPQMLERLKNTAVEQVPRVTAVRDGLPVLEDGRILEQLGAVIWCTGYRPDFSWIDIKKAIGENGWPITKRGVSPVTNGLYFMGVPFQFGLSSGLVGGVGRDADYIVRQLIRSPLQKEKI